MKIILILGAMHILSSVHEVTGIAVGKGHTGLRDDHDAVLKAKHRACQEHPASTAQFTPVAMARSPKEFFQISWDHAVYATNAVLHPRTMKERYDMGPCKEVQNILDPHIARQVVIRGLITWAIFSTLSFLVAKFHYPRGMPFKSDEDFGKTAATEFERSPMQLCADMKILGWTVFCPGIRWADTSQQTGFMGFWPSFWLMTAFWLIKWIYFWICTWFAIFDITGILLLTHRCRFRRKLHVQGSLLAWASDLLLSFFCAINIISHEARVTKAAQSETDLEHGAVDGGELPK